MMLRWINKQLRIQKFRKLFIQYQDSDKYHMIIYLSTQINSNTKVYGGNLLR